MVPPLYHEANIIGLVSWNWNGSHPSGTASEVKPGEVTVVSHRGNEISKTGDETNPAVHIDRSGNGVVKLANELNVDKKTSESNTNGAPSTESKKDEEKKEDKQEEKMEEPKEPEKETEKKEEEMKEEKKEEKKEEEKKETNGEAQVGDKRKADEKADAGTEEKPSEEKSQDDEAKKQKTSNGTAAPANDEKEKKKPGRPKGNNSKAPKKEKKAPAVGRAERRTRSQGGV
jgi:hypothetical protein